MVLTIEMLRKIRDILSKQMPMTIEDWEKIQSQEYINIEDTEMIKVNYRQLSCGEKFTYEGKGFTKSNHGRSFYHENGKLVFKKFKKRAVVDIGENNFEFIPPLD